MVKRLSLIWLVINTYLAKESCCFMQRDHSPHPRPHSHRRPHRHD